MAPSGPRIPSGKEAAFVAYAGVMAQLQEEQNKREARSLLKTVGGHFFRMDDIVQQVADMAAHSADHAKARRLYLVRRMLVFRNL